MENPYAAPEGRQDYEPRGTMGRLTTRLKRVGVISCGVMLGVMYALAGFVVGAVITLVSLGGAAANGGGGAEAVLFGVGSIVAVPVIYGVVGFVGGVIGAVIYNVVATIAGGIEMEFG